MYFEKSCSIARQFWTENNKIKSCGVWTDPTHQGRVTASLFGCFLSLVSTCMYVLRLLNSKPRIGMTREALATIFLGQNPASSEYTGKAYREKQTLTIEFKLVRLGATFNLATICIFQINLDDVVPVLPYSPQTSLLHDCSNDGT